MIEKIAIAQTDAIKTDPRENRPQNLAALLGLLK